MRIDIIDAVLKTQDNSFRRKEWLHFADGRFRFHRLHAEQDHVGIAETFSDARGCRHRDMFVNA